MKRKEVTPQDYRIVVRWCAELSDGDRQRLTARVASVVRDDCKPLAPAALVFAEALDARRDGDNPLSMSWTDYCGFVRGLRVLKQPRRRKGTPKDEAPQFGAQGTDRLLAVTRALLRMICEHICEAPPFYYPYPKLTPVKRPTRFQVVWQPFEPSPDYLVLAPSPNWSLRERLGRLFGEQPTGDHDAASPQEVPFHPAAPAFPLLAPQAEEGPLWQRVLAVLAMLEQPVSRWVLDHVARHWFDDPREVSRVVAELVADRVLILTRDSRAYQFGTSVHHRSAMEFAGRARPTIHRAIVQAYDDALRAGTEFTAGEHPELLATHLQWAGTTDAKREAVARWRAAGDKASGQGRPRKDHEAAIFYAQALKLAEEVAEEAPALALPATELLALHRRRLAAYAEAGRLSDQSEAIEDARQLAARLAADQQPQVVEDRFAVHRFAWEAAIRSGRVTEAERLMAQLEPEAWPGPVQLQMDHMAGLTQLQLGRLRQAKHHQQLAAGRGEDLLAEQGWTPPFCSDHDPAACCAAQAALTCWLLGEQAEAGQFADQAAAAAERNGQAATKAAVGVLLAATDLLATDHSAADKRLAEVEACRSAARWKSLAAAVRAAVWALDPERELAQRQAALERLTAGRDTWVACREHLPVSFWSGLVAEAQAALGHPAAARETLCEAIDQSAEGDAFYLPVLLSLRSVVADNDRQRQSFRRQADKAALQQELGCLDAWRSLRGFEPPVAAE